MNGRRIQTNLPDGTSWRYGYDRLSQVVSETPSYDADGNMLTNGGWTYAWNAQDRLVSAAKGTIRLVFAYDYMGRRFEKKVYENSVLTKRSLYAYDGFKQIAEYDALDNNALLNTYLWQPAGLDVPLLRNGSEFYVSDANKNVVALIDTTGTVTDTYIYDPFGNCTHTGDSSNTFRFSSEYFDEETGLVYYNYRYYSPELGRWIKRDPIGEMGGVNLYNFIGNMSQYFFDYLGLRRLNLFFDLEIRDNGRANNRKSLAQTDVAFRTDQGVNPYFHNMSSWKSELSEGNGIELVLPYADNRTGERRYFRNAKEVYSRLITLLPMEKYEKFGRGCNCIEHIYLAQHGRRGRLSIGNKSIYAESLSVPENSSSREVQAYLEELKRYFIPQLLSAISERLCQDEATVEFVQCFAGAGEEGKTIMSYLQTYFHPYPQTKIICNYSEPPAQFSEK